MSTTTTPRPSATTTTTSTGSPLVAMTRHAIRERLPLVGAVSALLIGMGLLVGALWPSLQDTFADLQSSLPDAFTTFLAGADMSTPSGWANAEMMSMIAPAAVIAVAVIAAAKSTAGEEETKVMGMVLGAPVSRAAYVTARSLATVVVVALTSLAVGAGLGLGSIVGDMSLGIANIIAASAHTGALGILFGSIALAVSAWTGNSKLTTAIAAGLAGLAFAMASFLPLSDSLAHGAKASPWYYYNSSDPLTNGANYPHLAVLLVTAVLLMVLAPAAFSRRDLRG